MTASTPTKKNPLLPLAILADITMAVASILCALTGIWGEDPRWGYTAGVLFLAAFSSSLFTLGIPGRLPENTYRMRVLALSIPAALISMTLGCALTGIWLGDPRWGYTAGVLLVVTVASVLVESFISDQAL